MPDQNTTVGKNTTKPRNRRYRKPLGRSIQVACTLVITLLCMIIGAVSYKGFRDSMMSQFEENLGDILEMTVARIDADDLAYCVDNTVETEKFQELLEFLDQERVCFDLDSVVLFQPVREGDSYDVIMIASGLLPEERAGKDLKDIKVPHLGDRIGVFYPPEFLPVVYAQLQDCHEIVFSTDSNDFGRSHNGAVGIYRENGEPVALLTAGLSLEFIDTTMHRYLVIFAVVMVLLILLFDTIMISWLRRKVILPLRKIEAAASEFDERSRTQKDPEALMLDMPMIHSGDELESLADALGSMSTNMKRYVEDLLNTAVMMNHLEQDLDKSKQQVAQLGDMAVRDPLTGIRNKNGYHQEVERVIGGIEQGDTKFGVVMVDLNFLKRINDTHGHDKGNESIVKLCKLVCETFAHSPVFRVGGDEFVAIVKGGDYDRVESLVARFNQSVQESSVDESLYPWERTSAAIGYALFDSRYDAGYDDVFRRADKAMYEHKKAMKAQRAD